MTRHARVSLPDVVTSRQSVLPPLLSALDASGALLEVRSQLFFYSLQKRKNIFAKTKSGARSAWGGMTVTLEHILTHLTRKHVVY